jgi:hypothetical protein
MTETFTVNEVFSVDQQCEDNSICPRKIAMGVYAE